MKIPLFIVLALLLTPRCRAVSLDLPTAWKIDSPPAAGTAFSASYGNDATILVVERPKEDVEGGTLAEVLTYLTKGMKAQPSYANESKVEPVKAGTLAGITVDFDLTTADQNGIKIPARYQCALFLHDGNYIFALESARLKLFPNFKKAFDSAVQTMKP